VVLLVALGLRASEPELEEDALTIRPPAWVLWHVTLRVTVTKEERILFGEQDVTDSIEIELRSNERVQRESELYIRADKEARYGIVARVVAAARASGVRSLNLLVQPELEEAGDDDEEDDTTEEP
jgi:biopolymer transport protein TolR